jgi:hypothetical protein
MVLYHCSPIWLEPGSVIRPGNYGRIIWLLGPNHPHWRREQALEQIRAAEFPDKPSRLTSAYTCLGLDATRLFASVQMPSGVIYEVEMVDPQATTHVSNFNCVQPIPGVIENMDDVARLYWRSAANFNVQGYEHVRCDEMLVDCGLRITAEVT